MESANTMTRDREESERNVTLPLVYFLGGYHPVNESFIRTPPSNVRLHSRVPVEAFNNFERVGEYASAWTQSKNLADKTFAILRMPRLVPVIGSFDLVHTNGSIIPLTLAPWIASVENPSAFYGFREGWHERRSTRRRLARYLLSRRCRAILPYTEASKRYLMLSLDEWKSDIEQKTQILHPAIDEYLITATEKSIDERFREDHTVKFLFVGNHFFDKGGREALRAFRHLRDKEKCELTIVSSAPSHQEKEFNELLPRLVKEPGVRFYRTGLPRARLMELYKGSDVFVFPSYMDQVPFVLLEAMAAGLPIIGSNAFGIPEMATEGENGFNIKSDILAFPEKGLRTEKHLEEYRRAVMDERNFDGVVEQLVDVMARIVRRPDLMIDMGKKSLSAVERGDFSVQTRNERLAGIYERSLDDRK